MIVICCRSHHNQIKACSQISLAVGVRSEKLQFHMPSGICTAALTMLPMNPGIISPHTSSSLWRWSMFDIAYFAQAKPSG